MKRENDSLPVVFAEPEPEAEEALALPRTVFAAAASGVLDFQIVDRIPFDPEESRSWQRTVGG